MSCWALSFLLLQSISGVWCIVKTWQPSTSMEGTNNWSPERSTACGQDSLIFPQIAISSLSSTLSVKRIVLPSSGEIILNDGSGFSVPAIEEACQGLDYEFSSTKRHHWWKPSNWNFTSPDLLVGGQGKVTITDVIPDADRVPCSIDDVVIPKGTAFRLILQGTPVVRSLTINEQEMDSASFNSFVSSAEGRRLVEGDGQLSVENETCRDSSGCICTNAMHQANNMMICEAIGACPATDCKDPIMPDGFCCPFCCSLADFSLTEGFKFSSLRSKLQDLIKEVPVTCYLSKRTTEMVQLSCVDNADKGNAQAYKFVKMMANEVRQDSSLHVSNIRTLHSVVWPSSQDSTDVGLVVGMLFLILFLAAAVGVGVYYYRKKRLPDFNFVRFDRGARNIEVELGTTPHDELQPQDEKASSSSKSAFYNPVYSKEKSPSELERMPDKRENPLYGLDDDVVEA